MKWITRGYLWGSNAAHLFDPYWTRHAAYTMGYDLPWPEQYESVSRHTARCAFDFGATE